MAAKKPESPKLVEQPYPRFIKYMGSKSKIMDFVLEGINDVYQGGLVCDLFAGSASLAGALGQQCAVHSNDIQAYSAILSRTYSQAYRARGIPDADTILAEASDIVSRNAKALPTSTDFSRISTIDEFKSVEDQQRALFERNFRRDWHLFVKYYSGTWWSQEQCLWIDAIREIAARYEGRAYYPVILSSLMFAMAYTSQGTGHYAQYRDATSMSSLDDILLYRRRSIRGYFHKKYNETINWLPSHKPKLLHKSTALDYKNCLDRLGSCTVYADPPYCFVHYSRFYHAIETLVLYDYPNLQVKNGAVVKGRYRENRHQSPFCIASQVRQSFIDLFQRVESSGSTLALSYSNTGMISIEDIESMALEIFKKRKIEILLTNHQHMTLGRSNDRHREVKECLLLIK